MTKRKQEAFEYEGIAQGMYLENYTIPYNKKNLRKLPKKALVHLIGLTKEKIPFSIGYEKKYAYFIIHYGQGPYLGWSQRKVIAPYLKSVKNE